MRATPLVLDNASAASLRDVPELAFDEFRDAVVGEVAAGGRVVAFFGTPRRDDDLSLLAVIATTPPRLAVLSSVVGGAFRSMAEACPQVAGFEREIAEQWGVRPEGHPWWKPLRYHASWRAGRDAWGRREGDAIVPSVAPFFSVDGEEVHEVAVGPVHAGIIEPGHFRFECHGETVLHLEISLGFQHRGVERALLGGPGPRTIHFVETVAGDTTAGHALAYAHAFEALAECDPPTKAHAQRAVARELERLANHVGDLGALAGDVGYLPAASYCGRLRGEFLNLTATVCGSRLGRGWIRPGGVAFEAESHADELRARLDAAMRDLEGPLKLLFDTSTVRARFEETGTLTPEVCRELGLVGPPARACGLERDARKDFPLGAYRRSLVNVATWPTGDVFARAQLRALEARESARIVRERLQERSEGALRSEPGALRPESLAVALVEGWRGEICHVAVTDARGRFARYKIVDPSFHNWSGLAVAMRGQPISDFPLCNKSFNLSYCGHDL